MRKPARATNSRVIVSRNISYSANIYLIIVLNSTVCFLKLSVVYYFRSYALRCEHGGVCIRK